MVQCDRSVFLNQRAAGRGPHLHFILEHNCIHTFHKANKKSAYQAQMHLETTNRDNLNFMLTLVFGVSLCLQRSEPVH